VKKFFTAMLVVMVVAGAGLLALGIYAWDYYEGAGPKAEASTILFKRGEKFEAIVDQLAENGIITHPKLFEGIAVAVGAARHFKAGEYNFPAAATPRTVMGILASGKVVVHKITIAEGLRTAEILQILANEPALDGPLPIDIKEGSLLPETYHYIYGDSRAELIGRMRADMKQALDSLWATRRQDLPFTTPEQALILASIVEKETGLPDERGRVAAVFINRLKKGMKLQSDPTTAYGLEQEKAAPLGRALTLDDLKTNTPYNTYVISGLPPTPIDNPGRAAIAAVLNPPDTKDIYFVATGNGGHSFSETLASHNKNVVEYRKVVKEKKKKAKKS
jgi:UPF0755 protein